MRTFVVTLLAVFCVGTADELAWRTEKATPLGALARAEKHCKVAEAFRIIDAKQTLLRLYHIRGRSLSAEEAAQALRWKQDVAACKAINVRR